jgi:8-hydroxy-5-deazaflavin:NADPH oxidoreductase
VREPAQVFSAAFDTKNLDGKIIIDLNNRDYADAVGGENPKFFEKSLGEALQENLPKSKVVKAFMIIPMETLDTSAGTLRKDRAQIFVAGADEEARVVVKGLAADLGFESVDLGGGGTAMRVAEALGDAVRFIIIDGGLGVGVNIGIRMLGKPDLGLVGERGK